MLKLKCNKVHELNYITNTKQPPRFSYVRNLNKEITQYKTQIYKDMSHKSTVTISIDAIFLKTILIFMLSNLINTITNIFEILIVMYYIAHLILQKVKLGLLKTRENLCQSQFLNSI
jgi:hypothetical protein